jgi:hypothetical protein
MSNSDTATERRDELRLRLRASPSVSFSSNDMFTSDSSCWLGGSLRRFEEN